jgi:photosystem II stability/assembly factor-like uncharacterized protein
MTMPTRPISFALLLLIAASASAAERKTQRELLRERGERLSVEVEEGEDPEARYREQRNDESQLTDAALLNRLRVARRERDLGAPRTAAAQTIQPMQSLAAQPASAAATASVVGSSWINLGPDDADMAQDGPGPVDSGRLRSIVPHPGNPDILFIATAGGGVWKTYDGGVTWIPLTDRLGALGSGSLAMDPHNPDILAYGLGDPFDASLAASGITVSTDGGATWSEPKPQIATVGTGTKAARSVRELRIDPLDSRHIVAATNVGLFSSYDFGATWQQAQIPAGDWSAWSVGYLGSGTCPSGTGLCSSWLASLQVVDDVFGEIEMHLFRSADSGASWSEVQLWFGESKAAGRATIAVAPSTAENGALSRVYVVASTSAPGNTFTPADFTTRDVYRSDDGGRTFRGLGVTRNGVPLNPDRDVNGLDVLSFQSWYNQTIAVDAFDPDVVLIGGMLAMIRTTDGGKSWAVVSDWLPIAEGIPLPYVHADFHAMASIAYPGAASTRFFFGSDGGLFHSDDLHIAAPGQGHVSSALNKGIVTHLVYTVVCAKDSWPEYLQGFTLGGFQDNGTRMRALPALSPNASTPGTFDLIFGGDGFGAGATRALGTGPNAGPAMIISTTFGGAPFSPIHATLDSGKHWTDVGGGIDPTTLPFKMQIATDDAPDSDGATFLTFSTANQGQAHVFRLTNATALGSWTKIDGVTTYPDGTTHPIFLNPFNKAATPHALTTHARKSGVYGFTADSGGVFVTADAGAHWRASKPLGQTAQGSFLKGAQGIAFDWSDLTGNTVWVGSTASSMSNAQGNNISGPIPDAIGHLFHTTDAGLTWQPVHGSGAHTLPNVEVNVIKVDPTDSQTVYVGTYLGLYVTHDGGATFDRMGVGLPLASVSDICITASTGSIKVSTYGRGFWEIDQHAPALQAGAHGRGDMDFNQRIDAFDLIDLVSRMGTNNQSDLYRQEADLVGNVAAIDDADLTALLARFGGTP